MKNIKSSLLVASLIFSITTHNRHESLMEEINKDIHNCLKKKKHHIKKLDTSKLVSLKDEVKEILHKASDSEKAAYANVTKHLEKLDPKELTKNITALQEIVKALKEVNEEAYSLIKENIPLWMRAFI